MRILRVTVLKFKESRVDFILSPRARTIRCIGLLTVAKKDCGTFCIYENTREYNFSSKINLEKKMNKWLYVNTQIGGKTKLE